VTWTTRQVEERVWVFDPTKGEWPCSKCGFENKPRPVPNSLNTIPADHKLFDPGWRQSHCEQCGAEREG
jgi:zinc finger protein